MILCRKLLNAFRALFQKQKLDADMDDEMRSHIEMRTQQNVEAGMSPEEARYAALRQFGWTESIKETCREQRGVTWLEHLAQDVRYGARQLRKNPGFTAVAVLTLALGIGSTTAIFSVVNAILVRALPFPDSERLVSISETSPQGNAPRVAPATFLDWKEQARAFDALAAYRLEGFNVSGGIDPVAVHGGLASANLFEVLNVSPALGRLFVPDDDQPGATPVVVLTDRLWKRSFGADPAILGRQIRLQCQDEPLPTETFTVVGILPQNFWFLSEQFEFWMPQIFSPAQISDRAERSQHVIGRLKPGVSVPAAAAEMNAIAARVAANHPQTNAGRDASVQGLRGALFSEAGVAALVLLGTVGFVLLIICANLANLVLARALTRQREMAIRAALGATRARLMRQALTECVCLALIGGGLGCLVARCGIHLARFGMPAKAQSFLPGGAEALRIDWMVLVFGLGLSAFTTVIFGLAPALTTASPNLNLPLKGEIGIAGHRSSVSRLKSSLAVAQTAIALLLLTGAGLMLRSLAQMSRWKADFSTENVWKFDLAVNRSRYRDPAEQALFFQTVLERVRVLPGVDTVALADNYPMRAPNRSSFVIEGRWPERAQDVPEAALVTASSDFFRALSVPLQQGRAFTRADNATALPVVIVNETMVRKYWPGGNVLGQRIRLGSRQSQAAWQTVIGVVRDTRQEWSGEPILPAVYRPLQQTPATFAYLFARGHESTPALASAISQAIGEVDRDLPVAGGTRLRDAVRGEAWGPRLTTYLLSAFGVVALGLAALGIYGVVAASVSQRTREFGIRMALGARVGDVLRLVLGGGAKLIGCGALIGLVGALALSGLMENLLYGVAPHDLLTFVAVPPVLCAVALFACYVPARRATKVDPMVALRYE